MNMTFINNIGVADWLNRYNSVRSLAGNGIDQYVSECIYAELSRSSPAVYAMTEYNAEQLTVMIRYATILRLFGDNFIGLLIKDGKDYSKIIKDLEKFDVDNEDATQYTAFNRTIDFDRYYTFEDCPLVIHLYEIDIFHVKSPEYSTPMPELRISCEIVNKDKVVEEDN